MTGDVEETEFPAHALLAAYAVKPGCQTDCFSTFLPAQISLEDYIRAFFHSPVFRLERAVITVFTAKPTGYADVDALATGVAKSFAVWETEARDENQILLSVQDSRIRTWLMRVSDDTGTRLYFGSAVLPRPGKENGGIGRLFQWTTGLHKQYSRILLRSARRKLARS